MELFVRDNSNIESESDIDSRLLDDYEALPDGPELDESPLGRDGIDPVKPLYDHEFDDESFDTMGESAWMKNIPDDRKQIDYQDIKGNRAIKSIRNRIYYRIKRRKVNDVIGRYWLDLIITANIIRQIANLAIGHKAIIRWFDYGGFENKGWELGGTHGLLIPINAVEQNVPSWGYTKKSSQLRLCAVNERCLSFYSPGNKSRSGVLFCGDSPMGYGKKCSQPFIIPQQDTIPFFVATAPHHGSQTNARAYNYILNQIRTIRVFWIRTGGTEKHPGDAYRRILPCLRLCTRCPRYHKKVNSEASICLHYRGSPFISANSQCHC